CKTSVQLQSTNAQTPPKIEEYQRPESKTNQQLAEPDEICKTSIPGSNPGGASKILKNSASFVRAWRKQPLPSGLKLLTRRPPPSVQDVASPRVLPCTLRGGRRFTGPPSFNPLLHCGYR